MADADLIEHEEPSAAPVLTRRRIVGTLVFVAVVMGVLYVLIPRLAGLDQTWRRLQYGDPAWLVAAVVLELGSYAGYLVIFRAVVASQGFPITWGTSYAITFAGVAATRLLAAAGAGGIALTAWALRRLGMSRRDVGAAMTAFLVAVYAVFMLALVGAGIGLGTGLLNGADAPALTYLPAGFGAAVIVAALVIALVPADVADRYRFGAAPATIADGVRGALQMVRVRDPGLLGAVAWWAFDIAVLWACFHAFGDPPTWGVLVMGYFVGMLANVLPVPGGVGSVDGGMIGALIGLGVDGGLALVAVLSYRAIAFWLPTLPGAIAYVQLRRRLTAEAPAR